MTLQELLEWHEHNAGECRHEGEEGERAFHLQAVELLKHLEGHSRLCCEMILA